MPIIQLNTIYCYFAAPGAHSVKLREVNLIVQCFCFIQQLYFLSQRTVITSDMQALLPAEPLSIHPYCQALWGEAAQALASSK